MTEFKPGDKVRTLKATGHAFPKGTEGVVEAVNSDVIWPIRIATTDADGTRHTEIFHARELELIQESTVPTFQIGDKVRYQHTAGGDPVYNGRTGVVTAVPTNYSDGRAFIQATWDDGNPSPSHPFVHNLVLVQPEPETPADPELRERLIEQAVKVADFGSTPASVVEAAQAFEAYILGGTK